MKKILILQGGFNEEHKVSINTANEIAKALTKLKIHFIRLTVDPITFANDISKFKNDYICFNALHGTFGEDGKIQKILRLKGFCVTHSNQNSSKNCFNKIKSKEIIKKFKIITPQHVLIKNKDISPKHLDNVRIRFKKFVLKPASSGSSHGLIVIKSKKDLNIFCKEIEKFKTNFNYNEVFIIEKYISGKELTVSVIESKSGIKPLEVTEIVSLNQTYDYQAKYTKGFSKHYIPARISKKNYTKCLNLAVKVHKIFKCKTLSRVDFILSNKKNKIFFLEINSQPGMTKMSLLPEQANYQKIKFESIVLKLIDNA